MKNLVKTNKKRSKLWLAGIILSSFMFMQCQKEESEVLPQDHHDHSQEHPKIVSVPTRDLPEMDFPEPETANSPIVDGMQVNESQQIYPESSIGNGDARTNAFDFVDFDDYNALKLIPDQAKYTFATSPFYIQKVGNAWFHVKENNGNGYNPGFKSSYGHYHLGYQHFFPIINWDNGLVGKWVNGQYVIVQPLLEPRTLSSHYGDQWIKIYAYNYNSSEIPFEFWGIKVINGPVQVWMQKLDGSWSKWSSLEEATWSFNFARHVKQILISGVGSDSFTIDNIKVKTP